MLFNAYSSRSHGIHRFLRALPRHFARTDIAYDGLHCHPSINLLIARALQSNPRPRLGIDMRQMGFVDLAQRYTNGDFRLHQANTRPVHAQHD